MTNFLNSSKLVHVKYNTTKVIKGGGMAEIFSESSILSYELGVIGMVSANNLRVFLGTRAHSGPCGYRWQKVAVANNCVGDF